jgi:hypothetical protein
MPHEIRIGQPLIVRYQQFVVSKSSFVTSPIILLVRLSGTRDALVVGPQAFLIFERNRSVVALAEVALAVVGDFRLLELTAAQAQAAEGVVQFALRFVGGAVVVLGGGLGE